ncbi:NatC N(alpha)-terminal acetyltransferase Mak10 subunit [Penicillium atrosanguineum]|uniref:NatC N(alpha)-terminal acetyltransferase Mak10 subunit n=1 Tax=Penicillium atrosanguineum TaxID=1132637 RepID=UPI0023922E95|nr:NatC N(alpha)-terminal acetyltransferase Mak10 subunit [Penicillium atrosanguineum]KAJ5289774.1 NatC N(alpha)-terminal acetyltransferase Mak10 subunit [Penicillium atrosanguineum]
MAQHTMYATPGNTPIIHRQRAPSAPRAYGLNDNRQLVLGSIDFEPRHHYHGLPSPLDNHGPMMNPPLGRLSYPPAGQPMLHVPVYPEWNRPQMPREPIRHDVRPFTSSESPEYIVERNSLRAADATRGNPQYVSQRRTSNRDEFDGPHQILDPPASRSLSSREEELPQLPTNLDASEQDRILHQVNDRLSQCGYDFFARYQFPIPLEQDKRPVQVPSDREWNEWVHLLKRLATRRRIPRHALHNGQIKQLITVLENSLEMRHAAKHSSRPVKDDRNVLQLISAGTQVAKILKDSDAMQFFDRLYVDTEKMINERRRRVRFANT